MEALQAFLLTYGWQLALIAMLGIVLLGILKYANVFSNLQDAHKKALYLAFSVGFSVIAAIIYLLVISQFTLAYIITISIAIYGLNQTMYAVYETTSLKKVIQMFIEFLVDWAASQKKEGK